MDNSEFDVTLEIIRDSGCKPQYFSLSEDDPAATEIMKKLPMASRQQYIVQYNSFIKWRTDNNIGESFSENTLLQYFTELAEIRKPTSLMNRYSLLKMTLAAIHGIDINKYVQLKILLKQKRNGFKSKKCKYFTKQEVERFLSEAPDVKYLAVKVALIFGISSRCTNKELFQMETKDVIKQGDIFLVKLPQSANTSALTERAFIIREHLSTVVQKYIDKRPKNIKSNRFFMMMRKGKYTNLPVGKIHFASLPKKIALYLNLPDPDGYLGQCFRLTSKKLGCYSGISSEWMKNCGDSLRVERKKDNYSNITDSIDVEDLLESATTSTRNANLLKQLPYNRQTRNKEAEPTSVSDDIACKEEPSNWNIPSTSKQNRNENGWFTNEAHSDDEPPETNGEELYQADDSHSHDDSSLKIPKLTSELFLKSVMDSRKYAIARNKQWYEIERERIRQRDAELQLQGQWLDLMTAGLQVLEKHLDDDRA